LSLTSNPPRTLGVIIPSAVLRADEVIE